MCIVGVYGLAAGVMHNASNIFSGSYALLRGVLLLKYARTALHLPAARGVCLKFIVCFSIALAFWITSCFFDDEVIKWSFLLIGITIDYASPFFLLKSLPPIHHEHLPERCSLWVVMVTSVYVNDFLDDALNADIIDEREGGESMSEHVASCARVFGAISIPFCVLMCYCYKARFSLSPSALASFQNDNITGRLRIYALVYFHMILTLCLGLSAMSINSYMAICPLKGQVEWGKRLRARCGYQIDDDGPGRFLIYSVSSTFFSLAIYHALCSANASSGSLPAKRISMRMLSAFALLIVGSFFNHEFSCSDILVTLGVIGAVNVLVDRIEFGGKDRGSNQMHLLT